MLNTIIVNRMSSCNILCGFISTFLLLNFFRLAIRKELNISGLLVSNFVLICKKF
jgi:hypothetical protein